MVTIMRIVLAVVLLHASVGDKAIFRCAYSNGTVPATQNQSEDCKGDPFGHNDNKASFCYVLFKNNTVSGELEVVSVQYTSVFNTMINIVYFIFDI